MLCSLKNNLEDWSVIFFAMHLFLYSFMPKAVFKFLLVLYLSITYCNIGYAQMIPWKADRPLTWDDFKAKRKSPGIRKRFSATTSSRLRYNYDSDSAGNITSNVTASFNCARSWKKNNRLKSDLLKHEQIHFDIAELYARKMRKSFEHYAAKHKYNFNTDFRMKVIYERTMDRCRRCQHRYDRITRHSRRKQAQKEWNEKIKRDLEELRQFEN